MDRRKFFGLSAAAGGLLSSASAGLLGLRRKRP